MYMASRLKYMGNSGFTVQSCASSALLAQDLQCTCMLDYTMYVTLQQNMSNNCKMKVLLEASKEETDLAVGNHDINTLM